MGFKSVPDGTPYEPVPAATPYEPAPGATPYEAAPGSTPYEAVPGGVAAPTSVDAGPDQPSFGLLGAAPIQLAGSAVGATSYLWTKVSGTAAVVFADATNPLTTCTVDVAGGTALTLNLAATNAGGTTNDQVVITISATAAVLFTRMASGSRVNVGYEVGVSTETLNGSNFSQINDLGSAALHLTQATAGNQPSKTSGGPNSKNCITLQDAVRFIQNSTASIAAGKRLEFYAIHAAGAGAATLVQLAATATGVTNAVFQSTAAYRVDAKETGVAQQDITPVITPALTTNFVKSTIQYLAGGLVCKINGTTTSPALTGTAAADAITLFRFGSSAAAGGRAYLMFAFEGVSTTAGSACLSESAAIAYYINQQAAL